MWQDIIKTKVVKGGRTSVNKVLFRNVMYDVTSQYLIENHSGDEITIDMLVELKDPLKLLGIQKLKDDGYEGSILRNFQSWWINQFEKQLPAVLNKMIRLELADKGAGINENRGSTIYLLKAKNVRLKKKIVQLLEGEDWLSSQGIMSKIIETKYSFPPANTTALSNIMNQIKEVDSRWITKQGIVVDPLAVNFLTMRYQKQFKLKGVEILKRNTNAKPNKVKGDILRTVVSEYLEETGYRDYYITNDVGNEIFPRYLELHESETSGRGPNPSVLKEKVMLKLNSYFPSPYVSKQIYRKNTTQRMAVKETFNINNIIIKAARGKKSNKVKGAILRPLVIEYLEETGYRDYYMTKDVLEEIFPRYLALHKETLPKFGGGVDFEILKRKIDFMLNSYFPSSYVGRVVSKDSVKYRIAVKENIDLTNFGERMSKAYDPEPPKKITPSMQEDIDYVTGENEYEKNPTISEKIKQILSLEPIPYSHKKPKKEDVDKEDNCGCNSCNNEEVAKSGRCTKRTKKASSSRSSKKWMQCVPAGKGKYVRRHWGDPNAKVTGGSGNTKRKKAFNARHKCSTCKGSDYSARCMACGDWKKVSKGNLDKLFTSSGERLKLKDWERFKKRLRRNLGMEVPRDIYGRKSHVRIVDGDVIGNKTSLNISFKSTQGDRRYVHIFFTETEGDYFFTYIDGNIQLPDNEIFETEGELIERIIDLILEVYEQDQIEYDLRDKDEGDLTEEQNIQQLEVANPDSYWDRDKAKLLPKEIEEVEPPRDLNIKEAAELGKKIKEAEEKKRKLLEEQKKLKRRSSILKPVRGRKDVS